MTAWDVDRAIETMARRQHGVFSARQARRAGASTKMIRRRLATGRWIELDHHVYALPSHPGTWQRQGMAATLAVDGAAVSHHSAVHGLTGFRRARIHLVVAPASKHTTRLATVHRSTWPRVGAVDGIPTVSMADTFFQLAGRVREVRLRTTLADAVVAHDDLLPALRDRFVDLARSRLPGIGVLRALLDEHGDGATPPHSELERLLYDLLGRVEGLPVWTAQAPLPGWERGGARVDVLIAAWRLIVEADGRRWHTRVDDFERDRWRDNVATAEGYDILRFTYHQLARRQDEAVGLLRRYARARVLAA